MPSNSGIWNMFLVYKANLLDNPQKVKVNSSFKHHIKITRGIVRFGARLFRHGFIFKRCLKGLREEGIYKRILASTLKRCGTIGYTGTSPLSRGLREEILVDGANVPTSSLLR